MPWFKARKDFDLLVVPNEGHGVFRSTGDVSYGLRGSTTSWCAIYDKSGRLMGTRGRNSRLVRCTWSCSAVTSETKPDNVGLRSRCFLATPSAL
jgi:hypothetical protein